MSAQAQQAAPPGEALRRLSTGLAKERSRPAYSILMLILIVLGFGITICILLTQNLGAGLLVAVFFVILCLLFDKRLERSIKHDQFYKALLLILKDQADRVTCADLLFAARTLPPHAAAPLPELLRARLVEKLPYASAAELAALEPADRQWLRAQLTAPDTTEALLVAVLFALGTLRDREAQEAIQQLATHGSSERLREVAHDALTSGGEG